jgi:replicative DNA helicase
MTAMLGREPPHNFEAEQAVLGAILVNNSAWSQASETLSGQHFADPLHGKLFDMAGRLIERGQVVSAFALKTFAEQDDDLKRAGGGAYLAKLMAASVHALDVPAMAKTVRECAVRRGLIATLSEALPRAYDPEDRVPVAEQIEAVERSLYELADGATGDGWQDFRTSLIGAVKTAEAAHARHGLAGLPTGLKDLDEVLGGLHRSDLVIVAARPGMGKTALATGIAFHCARQQVEFDAGELRQCHVGFFSLEMSSEQLGTRILASEAGISSDRMRKGELSGKEMDRVLSVVPELEALPLYVDDGAALTIAALRTRARRLKRQHGLDLIVVDYLQLLQGSSQRKNDNRVQEVSEITRGLKTLAKELDVPVVALSQLSRNVESRSDKRPQLSDLRDSGSIEQDADVVIFVYREEYYLERGTQEQRAQLSDVEGMAELHIAKHRQGPTGLVKVRFDGPTTRFTDVDRSDGR